MSNENEAKDNKVGVGSGGTIRAHWPCFQRILVDFVEEIKESVKIHH